MVPHCPLLQCPPLPYPADVSTPAFSTPSFLTVPLCPLPQIPSTPVSLKLEILESLELEIGCRNLQLLTGEVNPNKAYTRVFNQLRQSRGQTAS